MISNLILLENTDLIAVDKPAKMNVTQPKNETQVYLEKMVSMYLKKPAYAAHRLDYDTSGVVIFAKNKPALTQLQQAFEMGHIKKTYQAIVCKAFDPHLGDKIEKSWVIENELARVKTSSGHILYSSKNRIQKKGLEKVNEFKKSYTHFQKIKENDSYAWIECHPKTGRTHQLRVHLSELGLPILGDTAYTEFHQWKVPQTPKPQRMFLHAEKIVLTQTKTSSDLEIKAPIPSEFLQFHF